MAKKSEKKAKPWSKKKASDACEHTDMSMAGPKFPKKKYR